MLAPEARLAAATVAIVVAAGAAGGCSPWTRDDRPPTDSGARSLRTEQVLALADGRVLVAGVHSPRRRVAGAPECDDDLTVIALDARGRRDEDFGASGAARVRSPGDGCATSVNELAIDPSDRVLVGATIFQPSDSRFEDNSSQAGQLTRLTPRGDLDPAFADRALGLPVRGAGRRLDLR